jgi:hypothetical protein
MLSRYGGRTIFADAEPFSYWIHVWRDAVMGFIVLALGIFLLLYRASNKKTPE